MREIGPEHHMAGDYFHVRAPWHIVAELPSACPNCGDAVKEGLPFHINSIGIICVHARSGYLEAGDTGWREAEV